MKNKILKISVLVIMIIVSVFALSGCTEQDNKPKTCQHDWVVTSEYSFFTNSYKTVSKCSKCGQVIK